MRKISAISIICASILANAQVEPALVGTLPSIIEEASGLQCPTPNACWTFNDSDDGSRLFKLNASGDFQSQIILEDSQHIDYEDIARSADGRYFIGDFGNNQNQRTDLKIYITEDLETAMSSSISTSQIEFELEDQTAFPPEEENQNFDIESMIHYDDSLYLFTRNRSQPFNGWTKIYRLPDLAGIYQAELVDSIFGNLSSTYGSITAADINPSGSRIVLITNGSIFLLTDFENGFSSAAVQYNFFGNIRSYEGVSFIDDCSLYIVDEGAQAGLYELNSCDILTGLDQSSYSPSGFELRGRLLIFSNPDVIENVRVLDSLGREIKQEKARSIIDLKDCLPGVYIVCYTENTIPFSTRFFIF